jgi:KDO2-lipid IV(A) lauroyltransferase
VLVLTAHFGSFELAIAAMARAGLPISVVHRPLANARLDAQLVGWRRRAGVQVLERGSAARAALRALREGRFLVVPLDQNAHKREGVFVPFFGRPACTRDGPARLALRAGTPVLPVFIFREPGPGIRHVIRTGAALDLPPPGAGGAAAELTARMTAAIEGAVREAPDHWIWNHRRWRTRPPGEPRLYPSRAG